LSAASSRSSATDSVVSPTARPDGVHSDHRRDPRACPGRVLRRRWSAQRSAID
jgi:hypothetical protein